MAIRIETRGPTFGRCNICGEEGKLTEDHTPPKGCIRISQVELHHITAHLSIRPSKTKRKGRISQNGVKYRTLCARCNNSLLGSHYDPTFIDFVNTLGQHLKAVIQLPPIVRIETKPQRLMRSLIGHLCAQGVNRYDKGAITEPLRDYFLDISKPLPEEVKVYCWPFPYKAHVMARDCGLINLKARDPVAIWFLKFFPIGFLITFNEPDTYKFHLTELSEWRRVGIDYDAQAFISLENIPPQFWPEEPMKDTVMLYGHDAIVAIDKRRII